MSSEYDLFAAFAKSTAPIQESVTIVVPEVADTVLGNVASLLIDSLLQFQMTEYLAQSILTARKQNPQSPICGSTLRDLVQESRDGFPESLSFEYPLVDSLDDGALSAAGFERVFEYLWCSAFCYFRITDIVLGPVPAYRNIVDDQNGLCESLGDFLDDLQPLRESTQRLISSFAQLLASPPAERCPLDPHDGDLYANLALAARLEDFATVENPERLFLESCFECRTLNIDFLKQESSFPALEDIKTS
jgi:hypothetical protein